MFMGQKIAKPNKKKIKLKLIDLIGLQPQMYRIRKLWISKLLICMYESLNISIIKILKKGIGEKLKIVILCSMNNICDFGFKQNYRMKKY